MDVPYQLHLDVSGTPFSVSRPLASKYPYSRLADMVYQNSSQGGHKLPLDPQAFVVLLQYLDTDIFAIPPGVAVEEVERVFDYVEIPSPPVELWLPPTPSQPAAAEDAPVPADAMPNADPPTDLPEDPVPTYEESTQGSTLPALNQPKKPTPEDTLLAPYLPEQLAAVREQRIAALLRHFIHPHINTQGLAGLYETTYVLVPSNVPALQYTPVHSFHAPAPEVLGFPSKSNLSLNYLPGPENAIEFWRQPAVLEKLRQALRARFATPGVPELVPGQPRKRGNMLRLGLWNGGWRAVDDRPASSRLAVGEVRVEVDVRAVSVRVMTEMGLFETRSGDALVLTVEVGS
ncbi:MAG: hypothetical protein M1829_001964 [Trizodia sp. TS-e1964]|nr:MAG: hypothetical protein M1829_001964 [Trizodia sp. TS-e1964]